MKRYIYSYTLTNQSFAPSSKRKMGYIDASSANTALAKIKKQYPKRKHLSITNWDN
jgi:hypothetical protein